MKEIKISESDLPKAYLEVLNECDKQNACYNEYFFTTTDDVEIAESTYTFMVWVDRQEFKIGNKYFYFEWNGNRETPPFLLHENKIFYRISNLNLEYNDPKRTEYVMIDLTEQLKE